MTQYPFVCDAVVRTGHRGNIFNAQLLPHSSRMWAIFSYPRSLSFVHFWSTSATVARDGQVRVSDVGDIMDQSVSGREVVYTPRQTNVRTLKCHDGSVKRIVTEDSPDLFLTVSQVCPVASQPAYLPSLTVGLPFQDGTVRQHDLRVRHNCLEGQCPAPLVQMKHALSTISLSPLTPYQFVIAGESPHVCCDAS
jgi:hypothetical protein